VNCAGSSVVFKMRHGSPFILHHKVEKDMFRTAFTEEFRTFFHAQKQKIAKKREMVYHLVWYSTAVCILTKDWINLVMRNTCKNTLMEIVFTKEPETKKIKKMKG
jgi:hypothetical protein